MNKHVFTTSAGLEVSFVPPSAYQIEMSQQAIIDEFRARGEPFEPPTYEVPVADGTVTQTFEHSETSLVTDEDRAKWAAYKAGLEHLNKVTGETRLEFCLEAIVGIKLPEDESWIKRQQRKHIVVPDDPEERLLHYKKTEILRTTDDIEKAVSLIVVSAYAGSVTPEEEAAAANLFRNRLQKAALERTGQIGRPAQAERTGAEGRVDPQPAIRRSSRRNHKKSVPLGVLGSQPPGPSPDAAA